MTPWKWQGKDFTEIEAAPLIESGVVGFVYLITDTETNEKYIGQKLMISKRKKPYTTKKGTRRSRRVEVETDWPRYYSSSKVLQEKVSEGHSDNLTREILRFGYSKGDLHLLELMEQLKCGALWDDSYLNGILNIRIHKKHISNTLKQELLDNERRTKDSPILSIEKE